MSGTGKERAEKFYWFLTGLREPAGALLSVGTGAFFTLWTTHDSTDLLQFPAAGWLIAAVICAVALILGLLWFFKPTYKTLAQNENAARSDLGSVRKSLQATLESLLWIQLGHMQFRDPQSRISIYAVRRDEFVLVARRSNNGEYERHGRLSRPLNQGVIGEAWRSASKIRSIDVETRDEWEAECVASDSFTPTEAMNLTMFARSICAVRLDTHAGDKIGMVVLESETANLFTQSTISKWRKSVLHPAFVEILAESHSHFPRIREREQERAGSRKVQKLLTEPDWKNPRR